MASKATCSSKCFFPWVSSRWIGWAVRSPVFRRLSEVARLLSPFLPTRVFFLSPPRPRQRFHVQHPFMHSYCGSFVLNQSITLLSSRVVPRWISISLLLRSSIVCRFDRVQTDHPRRGPSNPMRVQTSSSILALQHPSPRGPSPSVPADDAEKLLQPTAFGTAGGSTPGNNCRVVRGKVCKGASVRPFNSSLPQLSQLQQWVGSPHMVKSQ